MQKLKIENKSSTGLDYLLYLPDLVAEEKKIPLLLFLHGSGERGHDLSTLKKYGPPLLIENGMEFPFIVLAPQCPQGDFWRPELLEVLLEEVVKATMPDVKRIYITGVSMGAYGAWELAMHLPDTFAAIMPICGGGDEHLLFKLKSIPLWVFHGAKDKTVPVSESQILVDKLRALGANVKFTIYPEADHDSWTQTYNNPEVFKWLLAQKK